MFATGFCARWIHEIKKKTEKKQQQQQQQIHQVVKQSDFNASQDQTDDRFEEGKGEELSPPSPSRPPHCGIAASSPQVPWRGREAEQNPGVSSHKLTWPHLFIQLLQHQTRSSLQSCVRSRVDGHQCERWGARSGGECASEMGARERRSINAEERSRLLSDPPGGGLFFFCPLSR